jgi:hypothetical protein
VSFPAAMWNLHANDLGKGFGDKTREWEMDTVAALMKPKGDDADDSSMRFEFRKTRLRTPANAEEFLPLIIRPGDNWRFEVTKTTNGGKSVGGNDVEIVRDEFRMTGLPMACRSPSALMTGQPF